MAYRIGKDVTFREMFHNLYSFMREMTTISEIDYVSSSGNGALDNLSVPASTATTETWTLQCTNDTYPQQFSVQGNLTGNTATATVDSPYSNGIINFTLRVGTKPWVLGDIVTFSTQEAVYTAWTPRFVGEDITRAPEFIGGAKQKVPQYGSSVMPTTKGRWYRIAGPKPDSWGMSPIKKSRNSSYWYATYYAGNLYNSCAIGGSYYKNPIGRGDANEPTNFTLNFWTKRVSGDRQTYYYSRLGEVITSTADSGATGGTLGVAIYNGYLRAFANKYTSASSQPYYYDGGFYIKDYLATCGKQADDWFMITLVVDRANTKMRYYIDKHYLGEKSSGTIANIRAVFGGLGGQGDLADTVIFRDALDQTAINNIYDSATAVDVGAPEVYDSLKWDDDTSLPYLDLENRDNNGNFLSVQLVPSYSPYYSYRLDMIRNTGVVTNDQDVDIIEMNKMPYSNNASVAYNKGAYPSIYLLGEHPVDTVVDKYWFVVTNEYVAGVIKIFDQSTVQQLPVYQSFYMGLGDSLQDKAYTVVSGTSNTGNDYWYTGNANFRSGFNYLYNTRWFGQQMWQRPTRLTYPANAGGMIKSANSYNVWTIYHRTDWWHDGNSTNNQLTLWNGTNTYYERGLWMPENNGTFYGIYGIQANNVTPEDIIIIDGVKHLAFTDCTKSGANSMLLIRLD